MSVRSLILAGGLGLTLAGGPLIAQDAEKSQSAPPETETMPEQVPVRTLPPPVPVMIPNPPPPRMAAPPPPPAPSRARPPIARNQQRWASFFEYPDDLDFLGEMGITGVYATVNAQGRVSKCEVKMTSGFEALDEAACRAYTRYGRFDPALDQNGQPTEGFYSNRIRWDPASDYIYRWDYFDLDYPEVAEEQGLEGRVGVRFVVNPDGRVANCLVTATSGHPVLDDTTCDHIKTLQGSKALSLDGLPVKPRTMNRMVEWTLSDENDEDFSGIGAANKDVVASEADQVKADREQGRLYYAPAPPDYVPKSKPSPIGNEDRWITTADFPAEVWRNGDKGLVQYTLQVDDTGTPTDCSITYNEAGATLGGLTCRLLLERARFEPQRDKDGKAIAGNFSYEALWNRQEPEFSDAFTVRVSYLTDEAGVVGDCKVVERSGKLPVGYELAIKREPCPGFGRPGAPYRDEAGNPVAQRVTLTVAVVVEDVEPSN